MADRATRVVALVPVWRLLPSLREGMLLLADRNFAASKLVAAVMSHQPYMPPRLTR